MNLSAILKINNNKRRCVTSTEVDRISNLPENLIDSILERLPIQDAVRTHVLSKRWRYKWTTMRSLVLDKHFSEKFAKNGTFGHNGFIRITNQVFNLLRGPILKFYLHIPNMFLDSFQEVDQWILSLSRDGVRKLVLTNLNQRYQLPCYIFHCLELRKLELKNCIYKPPLEFQGFLYLKDLFLKDVEFGANSYGTVINLPQLTELQLAACTNVYNFNIKAPKLDSILVMHCPDAIFHRLLNNQWLTLVGIAFNKPIQGGERINLATMLSNLPYLESFYVDGYFLKLSVAEKIPKWLPHTANRLRNLRILNFNFGDLDHLQGALCMLRNSPNLEQFHLNNLKMIPQDNDFDMKPTISFLEASDCLDQTLNRLKTILFINVEKSKPLLLLIKLLLDHSPSLEKMSIQPSVTADTNEKLKIAKDVMRFPRASTKAEVLYLDP